MTFVTKPRHDDKFTVLKWPQSGVFYNKRHTAEQAAKELAKSHGGRYDVWEKITTVESTATVTHHDVAYQEQVPDEEIPF